jgi:hypothetical protein
MCVYIYQYINTNTHTHTHTHTHTIHITNLRIQGVVFILSYPFKKQILFKLILLTYTHTGCCFHTFRSFASTCTAARQMPGGGRGGGTHTKCGGRPA